MKGSRTIANEELLDEVSRRLAEGKRVKLRAKGDSMRPFIRGGEDIIVLAPPPEHPRRGDIVLARCADDRRWVIHRVVGEKDGMIVLAGDGNLYGKELCRRDEVYGMAVAVISRGKERSLRGGWEWRVWRGVRRVISGGWRVLRCFKRYI